jgi:hypothetical protein
MRSLALDHLPMIPYKNRINRKITATEYLYKSAYWNCVGNSKRDRSNL